MLHLLGLGELMLLIELMLGLQAATAIPTVTVKATGVGFRAEATTFEPEQGAAVHAEIERRAAEFCAEKPIKWGEFGSLTELGKDPGSTPPKISGYYQEFRCIAVDQRTYVPAPADWKPTPADEADVRGFFEDYYAKRDAGNFEAAVAMFSLKARPESTAWPQEQDSFNEKLGTGNRRITGVTWYVNPPSAEMPGVYAAADFVGDYPNVHFYCGYVVLYRLGLGSYEIVREEQNVFHRGDGDANPDHLAQMRAVACRGD